MAVMRVVKGAKDLAATAMRSPMKEVELVCAAPGATTVCVAGQFNDWNTASHPLKRGKDGMWKTRIRLAPGQYEYKFFVDGDWSQDAPSESRVMNSFGTYNRIIEVKAA